MWPKSKSKHDTAEALSPNMSLIRSVQIYETYSVDKFRYYIPLLDRMIFARAPSCSGPPPCLESKTGWTGELWSKTNVLKLPKKIHRIFANKKKQLIMP